MNCLNCNIRGITAPGRKTLIVDTLNRCKPSIVCFQETKKENLTDSFQKFLVGNRNFVWNMVPSIGSTGGILMGIYSDIFDILNWEILNYLSC